MIALLFAQIERQYTLIESLSIRSESLLLESIDIMASTFECIECVECLNLRILYRIFVDLKKKDFVLRTHRTEVLAL